MHVLWGVLQKSLPSVVVFNIIEWDGLKPPPPYRKDDWISRLEDFLIPTMFLQTHLREKEISVQLLGALRLKNLSCQAHSKEHLPVHSRHCLRYCPNHPKLLGSGGQS